LVLEVNEHVLIPRSETEELVDDAQDIESDGVVVLGAVVVVGVVDVVGALTESVLQVALLVVFPLLRVTV